MSGNDILTRVRRAVHMADSLHMADPAVAEQFLGAAERCRESNRNFIQVLEKLHPPTPAGEAARAELLEHLAGFDYGNKLLYSMFDAGNAHQAEIHTHIPPSQVQ